MNNYTLYCSSDNDACRIAENALTANKIQFDTVSVSLDKASSDLVDLFNDDVQRTPKVFYGTEYVGNLEDIKSLFGIL